MSVLPFKSIIIILLFRFFISIPVWDFNTLSINLITQTSYEYTVFEKEYSGFTATLKQKITKSGSTITTKNYLTIGSTTKEVEFEDLNIVYKDKLGYTYLVCPKGKYHPYDFENNRYFNPPTGFEDKGGWDLRCYYTDSAFMIFYLQNDNKNFYFQYNGKDMRECVNCYENDLYNYRMSNGRLAMIAKEKGNLVLKGSIMSFKSSNNEIYKNDTVNKILSQGKTNATAFFDSSYYLYFFSYNGISDFISGYSNTNIDFSTKTKFESSITDMDITINESPLNFVDEMEIKEMNFIQGTQYIYYKLYNKNKDKNYFGLVDIKQNKILYNTDEEIKKFVPLSNHEMLAITASSAYKLCIIKSGSNCLETCSSGNLILDPTGNKCQTSCGEKKIKLMPEEICIDKNDCDLNFYVLNSDETECGFCKYFYSDEASYKFINTLGCTSNNKNTDYYISHLNLIKCKANYHLEDHECIPDFCYERCETCSEIPVNENDQKCLSCKSDYILKNGNCVVELPVIKTTMNNIEKISTINDIEKISTINDIDKITTTNNIDKISTTNRVQVPTTKADIKCPEGYFLSEEKICLNCTNSCKKYEYNNCNCVACNNGFYLDNEKKICKICENKCNIYKDDSCECLSCQINYELIDNKCVEYFNNTNNSSKIYSFDGKYKGTNETMYILKTKNLTNVEDDILKVVRNKLDEGKINENYIDQGFSFVVEAPKAKFIITKSTNKNDIITSINLGECEDKLRLNKTISVNNSIYILYIEVIENGMVIPRTEYEVYYKSDINKFETLDLEICKGIKINKSVSINISNSDLDKYNSSSAYYNDICYTTSSDNGTDIILSDRRNEYINNNMSVCEADCVFTAYDPETREAICSCPIATSVSHVSDNKLDKNKFTSNFIDFKNLANVEMLKCYKLLFSKNIMKNSGCIIITTIILIGMISLILFYSKGFNLLKNRINNIFHSKELGNKATTKKSGKIQEKRKEKKNSDKSTKEDVTIYKNNNSKIKNAKSKNSKKEIKKGNNKKEISKKQSKTSKKNKNKHKHFPPKKTKGAKISKNSKIFCKTKNNILFSNENSNKTINPIELLDYSDDDVKEKKKKEEVMKFNDTELNLLLYQEAIILDKRTFCQYYASLIKTRHIIVFSFCYNKDYNSRIVKIFLFFFTFTVNYTINALFFNDDTMHKIYEDGGKFNLFYQIPQILYSSIISSLLIIVVKMLALSEKNILKIKSAKPHELNKIYKSESNSINCKFISFFIISFILLFAFWYYVGCFCAVYKNTQTHLLTDTLISFSASLFYPLALYLLPAFFRIPSLRNKEKNSEYMYKTSQMIQFFV